MTQDRLSDEEINGRFAALTAQRNAAENQVVILSGENARLRKEIESIVEQLKESKSDCEATE